MHTELRAARHIKIEIIHYGSMAGNARQLKSGEQMQKTELKDKFDKMAESYDEMWVKLAPINDALHLLIGGVLAKLPEQAKILCVGAGTGAEIVYLAKRFPQWTFTAVDPSAGMLDVCRERLSKLGVESRCEFHVGYLESLPSSTSFDAATSLLVSQFILDEKSRSDFFGLIAKQLKPEGILVSSDLSADLSSSKGQSLLDTWLEVMREGGIPQAGLEGMRNAYGKSVAVLPQQDIAAIISAGGFKEPVHFFQTGLIHAWFSVKSSA